MKKLALALVLFLTGMAALFLLSRSQASTNPQENNAAVVDISYCGWMPWWDYENALEDAKLNTFSSVSPFVYITEADASITKKVSDLKLSELEDKEVVLSVYNDFDGERISEILNSEEKTKLHIQDLISLLQENRADGIELDYEYLLAEDRDLYSAFVRELKKELGDYKLVVTVHPKVEKGGDWHGSQAQDWKALSDYADEVRVMIYDYSWETSEPGPISPLPWFKNVVLYAKGVIAPEKLTVGIGMYGYDWALDSGDATPLSIGEALMLVGVQDVEVLVDTDYESPMFTYFDGEQGHEVWLEDQESLEKKFNFLKNEKLSSVCVWPLGDIDDALLP